MTGRIPEKLTFCVYIVPTSSKDGDGRSTKKRKPPGGSLVVPLSVSNMTPPLSPQGASGFDSLEIRTQVTCLQITRGGYLTEVGPGTPKFCLFC